MIGVLDRVKGWLFEEGEGQETISAAVPQSVAKKKRNSLLSLHNNSHGEEIHVRRPHSRDEAPACADCLRARSAVIVNLKDLDEQAAKRVFDFLAGVVYAIEGQMETVGDDIFLLTPRDVDIATDLDERSRAQSEDMAFWQEQQSATV
jgi:cell division inhibitor SepF